MLSICIHWMKHFIHVICEWKLETVSAAHKISLVLALPRNIIIGRDHEMFALAYKSAAVKLHIFFLEFCLWYFSDANAMLWGEWYPCLICCFFESQNWRGEAQILDIHIHATLHKQGWHTFDATKIECWLQFVCFLRLLICFALKSVVMVCRFTSEDPCASFYSRDMRICLSQSFCCLAPNEYGEHCMI